MATTIALVAGRGRTAPLERIATPDFTDCHRIFVGRVAVTRAGFTVLSRLIVLAVLTMTLSASWRCRETTDCRLGINSVSSSS